MENKFDLLVIGFGKAGKTLAGDAARQGKTVALVEQSDQMYGGTCINIGCVPTKALVHSADLFTAAGNDAAQQGAEAFSKAVAFRDKLTGAMRAKNFEMVDSNETATVITGKAEFVDAHTVKVSAGNDTLELTADTIVINTGAVPVMLPIEGLRESKYVVDSTDFQKNPELPGRLAVIGGGPIGIEFASLAANFGAQVTVFEAAPKLFGRSDQDVADVALELLKDQGMELFAGVRINKVVDTENGVELHYQDAEGNEKVWSGDRVLAATGRKPATEGLNVEAAGLELGKRGEVVVDEYCRTNQDHIFAVGDVNGGLQFTYISLDDYRVVKDQLFGEGKRSVKDRVAVPNTIFITPPLASVGLTEDAAREAGKNIKVGVKPVAAVATMPWAKIVKQPKGIMKFVIDADSDQVLGAQLLMPEAAEVINLVAVAMRYGITASDLRDGIYTHPSATEGIAEVIAAAK
ncbi:pyridine nucleotide-disulfide oxidoreductase [Boudabousia liubingyangii]|uniref:Pyridine nucleotide-disulfide oxidoreductase n=1 Tax=Boudabousia liubingyangii TaxID=1921764 RepID=A0A1Q5PPF4_9ACTO|nr:FAD-dependent oxidoreductase [Boudabousia liubingyangii]OKL49471.1 pyridine nucleotide-disulfide oxidoreductase [Boudabousia liubingyangii]